MAVARERVAFIGPANGSDAERYVAHIQGARNVVAELDGDATLEVAVAWARERAPVVLVRLLEEQVHRSARAVPPPVDPTAPQWPRTPGDRRPERPSRWSVTVDLGPGLERLRAPEDRACCEAVVAAVAGAIGGAEVDATEVDAALVEEAAILRAAGDEEVGYYIVDPTYALTIEVAGETEAEVHRDLGRRIEVPADWWVLVRAGPVDWPVPFPRPF